MKKQILLGLFILIFVSGCELQQPTGNVVKTTQTQEEPFCAESYFEYQTGQCCLDANSNKICDDDDLIIKELEKVEEEPLIEEAPEAIEEEILVEDGVPEACPYTCEKEHVCNPVYNENDKISRWACVYAKS